MRGEEIWNMELIELLNKKLSKEFPKITIFKGKVLKDVFLSNWEGRKSLQFGFVDQDIVIYDETLNLKDFRASEDIYLHRMGKNNESMVIPKIIIELKYDGVTSHGLITYSNYASDIKSIFPNCRYYLVMRYKNSSSEDKLFRHGKYFDRILYLDEGKNLNKAYQKGQFELDLKEDKKLRKGLNQLVEQIKVDLRKKQTLFIKQ